MNLYKIVLGIIILTTFSFWSCTEEDDSVDNGKFTYLPVTFILKDTANVVSDTYTEFSYDTSNRIGEIADSVYYIINDSTRNYSLSHSTITYDGQEKITRLAIDIENRVEVTKSDGTTPQSTTFASVSHTFNYSNDDKSILIESVVEGSENKQSYSVELNDNQFITKLIDNTSGGTIDYEYDNNGNLSKSIHNSSQELYYNFDERRGIYREINMPQWFLFLMLEFPRNSETAKIGDNFNYHNNCLTVSTSEDVTYREYVYSYNAFGYPLKMTDTFGFELGVKYVRKY